MLLVAQGQQVFISYGEQTNDSLLQFYGFLEAGNPLDIYVLQDFTPRAVTAAAMLSIPLQRIAKQKEEQERFDARLSRTGPDDDVLQLLLSMLGLTLQPATHVPAYKVSSSLSGASHDTAGWLDCQHELLQWLHQGAGADIGKLLYFMTSRHALALHICWMLVSTCVSCACHMVTGRPISQRHDI